MDVEEPDGPGAGPDPPGLGWAGVDWTSGWEKWAFSPGRFGAQRPVASTGGAWGQLLERLVSVLKTQMLGRQLTVRTRAGDVSFTLAKLDVELDRSALAMGQMDDVTAVLRALTWRELSCERAVATLHNVHLQSGSAPQLVAAPVDLRVTLGQSDLDSLTEAHRPQIMLEITEDNVILVRWRRHRDLGHLEVEVDADGTRLWVRPLRLVRGQRGFDVGRRIPSVPFRLALPRERVSLLSVEATAGAVEVRARLDEARLPLGSAGPEKLLRRWSSLGSLIDLSTWTR